MHREEKHDWHASYENLCEIAKHIDLMGIPVIKVLKAMKCDH